MVLGQLVTGQLVTRQLLTKEMKKRTVAHRTEFHFKTQHMSFTESPFGVAVELNIIATIWKCDLSECNGFSKLV